MTKEKYTERQLEYINNDLRQCMKILEKHDLLGPLPEQTIGEPTIHSCVNDAIIRLEGIEHNNDEKITNEPEVDDTRKLPDGFQFLSSVAMLKKYTESFGYNVFQVTMNTKTEEININMEKIEEDETQ